MRSLCAILPPRIAAHLDSMSVGPSGRGCRLPASGMATARPSELVNTLPLGVIYPLNCHKSAMPVIRVSGLRRSEIVRFLSHMHDFDREHRLFFYSVDLAFGVQPFDSDPIAQFGRRPGGFISLEIVVKERSCQIDGRFEILRRFG